MSTRRARVGPGLALNVAAGWVLIESGAADALWRHVTPQVPWRTGPLWWAVIVYAGILFALHVVLNLPLEFWLDWPGLGTWADDVFRHGAMFLIASCLIVVVQVLMPGAWIVAMAAALAVLLMMCWMIERRMANAQLIRLRFVGACWAWLVAGLIIADRVIPPWSFGSPQYLPRLALLMSIWLALPRLIWRSSNLRQMMMCMPSWVGRGPK